eukprot:4951243-Prymnesium_polylepis.1
MAVTRTRVPEELAMLDGWHVGERIKVIRLGAVPDRQVVGVEVGGAPAGLLARVAVRRDAEVSDAARGGDLV